MTAQRVKPNAAKITAEEVMRESIAMFERMRDRSKRQLDAFGEKLKSDPLYAVEWSDDLAAHAAENYWSEFCLDVLEPSDDDTRTPEQVLFHLVDYLERERQPVRKNLA